MWILEIPDSQEIHLKEQSRWLRPGSTTTFGRNSSNSVVLEGAKSVSKQHCKIVIGEIEASEVEALDHRSVISIEDCQSKFHTWVQADDQPEIQVTKTTPIQETTLQLRLGKLSIVFKIYWKPLVLTLSNYKPKDVLGICVSLDIRLTKEYDDRTTHVLTRKYNTPKTLLALIYGRHIIGKGFIDKMAAEAANLSKDFIEFMPSLNNPEYLPSDSFSDEYGHASFQAKIDRRTVFRALNFVFFEADQKENLVRPIEAGSGTAHLYRDDITYESLLNYLKRLQRPVLIEPRDETYQETLDPLIARLRVSKIVQGELLRIILSNGAHTVYSAGNAQAVPATDHAARDVSRQQQKESSLLLPPITTGQSQTQSRRLGSRITNSLATFDEDVFGMGENFALPIRRTAGAVSRGAHTQTQPLPDLEEAMTQVPPSSSPAALRKYHVPASQDGQARCEVIEQDVEAMVSEEEEFEVAPAAAAFSRQKEKEIDISRKRKRSPKVSDSPQTETTTGRSRLAVEELTATDIHAALRANKKRAEQKMDDGPDVCDAGLRNLGTVEFFKMTESATAPSSGVTHASRSERWDPKWNNRKNFKMFRRPQKEGSVAPTDRPPARPLIIRLVESAPSDRGLMDKQWLETATTRDRAGLHHGSHGGALSPKIRRENTAGSRGAASRSSQARSALFMNDDSDSDEDPLKFRMI